MIHFFINAFISLPVNIKHANSDSHYHKSEEIYFLIGDRYMHLGVKWLYHVLNSVLSSYILVPHWTLNINLSNILLLTIEWFYSQNKETFPGSWVSKGKHAISINIWRYPRLTAFNSCYIRAALTMYMRFSMYCKQTNSKANISRKKSGNKYGKWIREDVLSQWTLMDYFNRWIT